MEERIKNDLNFVLSKYGESFVAAESYRRQILLEEITKFKETTVYALDNKSLSTVLKLRTEELGTLQKEHDRKIEKYTKELRGLRKEIEDEKKEKINLMERMVHLLEVEKNTRERIFGYMENNDDDEDDDWGKGPEEKAIVKDRLAQFFDDVEAE